jgi:hypothetical protein
MDKIKQYKKQIFTFVTIFLLLQFGVYPCLTMANTFANILGAVALLLLVLWGGLSLYDYVRNSEGLVDKKELSEAEQLWKEKVEKNQNDEFEQKDDFQIKAGIKGDFYKNKSISPELAKEFADSWRGKVGNDDPLADIPMSRVSPNVKKQIAEIAINDIKRQLDENQIDFSKIQNIGVNKVNKTEKVLGEFQINNKEKVRKSTIKKTK